MTTTNGIRGPKLKAETLNAAGDAFRALPSVSVAGLVLWGVSLQDWVLLATLVYTVSAFLTHAYKNWIKPFLKRRKDPPADPA